MASIGFAILMFIGYKQANIPDKQNTLIEWKPENSLIVQWTWDTAITECILHIDKFNLGLFYRLLFKLQGVPWNMTIARRLESRLWYSNLFVTFSLLSTLTCIILEIIITKFPLSCHFQNVVCLFCAFNIARDMKNFVQISTILLLFNKIEIWTKLFISLVILKVQKTQTTFWKCQG